MKDTQQIGRAFRHEFKKIFYGDRVTQSVTKKKNRVTTKKDMVTQNNCLVTSEKKSVTEEKSLVTKNRKRINCSVSKEEFKKISLQAKQADLSPTAFFKKAAFSYLENENILPKTQEKILRDFIFQFRKIGNNLNQIARQTNRVKQVVNFFDLKKELQRLRSLENSVQKFIKNPPKK